MLKFNEKQSIGRIPVTKIYIDIDKLIPIYNKLNNVHKTAEYFKCSAPTICRILKEHNIPIKTNFNREYWEDFYMDLMAFRYMTEVMEAA